MKKDAFWLLLTLVTGLGLGTVVYYVLVPQPVCETVTRTHTDANGNVTARMTWFECRTRKE